MNRSKRFRTAVAVAFLVAVPCGAGGFGLALWCAGISAGKEEIHMPKRGGVRPASPAGWPRLAGIPGDSACLTISPLT
jgi:hypothetical protein